MSAYSEFFLNGPARIVQLETLEIAHPNFSKTYWIVRNSRLGITATLEDRITKQFFEYYPLKIIKTNTDNSLDQIYRIQVGDLGEILPKELDRIAAADNFLTKPTVNYRIYRSDDLRAPLLGPMRLEIVDLPFNSEGVAFEAKAPTLNQNQTGINYNFDDFPGVRAFV